jgi:hypothetical protein
VALIAGRSGGELAVGEVFCREGNPQTLAVEINLGHLRLTVKRCEAEDILQASLSDELSEVLQELLRERWGADSGRIFHQSKFPVNQFKCDACDFFPGHGFDGDKFGDLNAASAMDELNRNMVVGHFEVPVNIQGSVVFQHHMAAEDL